MKRTLLFIACVLVSISMQAQAEATDYLPFVENGKQWHAVRSVFGEGFHLDHFRLMDESVVKDGKSYMRMYVSEDDLTEIREVGLLRETDKKVYFFDSDRQKEFLLFDYSLKAGDTYDSYSPDEMKEVSYKVLKVENYVEGPEVIRYVYQERGDSLQAHKRYLKKWTVCRTDDDSFQKTWIEGVGSLESPLANYFDVSPVSVNSDLAYVEYQNGDFFLPFSFYNDMSQVHGSNLPSLATYANGGERRHDLTYELLGDCLHVYGKALAQRGPNNYAYFIEKPTDDPLVRKIEFEIEGVEPTMDGMALHATNFYVPGFDPNINYVVVDNFGKEHPVVNRTPQLAYRPFIEDGKVWKVGSGFANPVQDVRYYYFDGDTVIDGKTCKRMMCQQYVGQENASAISPSPSESYVGAWYEENQKVYMYDMSDREFWLMYDFSAGKNDTLTVTRAHQDYQYVIGPKQSGDLKAFKGVYRNIRWIDEGSIIYSPTWLEGVGSIDSPVNSFYFGYVDPLSFLMSCVVGDEVIYLDDTYVDGATPESAISEKRRFDFTHTIKTRPKAPIHRLAEASETTSLYGEYSDQRLGINLNPLDQAYLVSITDMSGRAIYEKAIDAGTIVALDIDISAYPKGHYTVTVENSNEVFTGEFDSQTEGIEVVSNKKTDGENIIFNLQGQRISSLKKGLNIVNGQKVCVK